MLVNFHSPAAAGVTMLEQPAQQLLALIGKDVRGGTLAGQELGDAVALLEGSIEESKTHAITSAVVRDIAASNTEDHQHISTDTVSFASRAFPLLELMRKTRDAGADLQWSLSSE